MATKSSGELPFGSSYSLGAYSFRLERKPVSGSTNDQIDAICTQGGKNARKSIQIPSSTKIESWSVEANDTTADVYINTEGKKKAICWGPTASAGTVWATGNYIQEQRHWTCTRADEPVLAGVINETYGNWQDAVLIGTDSSNVDGSVFYFGRENGLTLYGTTTVNNITFKILGGGGVHPEDGTISGAYLGTYQTPMDALTSLVNHYFKFESVGSESALVGRFAIDLGDAGGEGSGSDWDDPGDHDDYRDPEDPTTTLYLTVEGALSGRHNDPLEDPSYSYIPTDKATVKDYGCGGDGGNGGGGGGGAANVVVFKFATSHADHKDITVKAKRHGYGSGGGKGGKGGDGCILIYY